MTKNTANGTAKDADTPEEPVELICGLIMPISALDNCTADHWSEVKGIITEAVESIPTPRFVTRLVSDADETGVIQKRILQNVYNSSIVVCDVSGKNPNVMFELGLRLAFDKPTVIIKDDRTDYSFDTGVVEHVAYPRDLRFARIVEFKKKLAEKVTATHRASVSDPTHSPFLKSFGQFHVATLAQSEASTDRVILGILDDIQKDLQLLKRKDRELLSLTSSSKSFEAYIRKLAALIDKHCLKANVSIASLSAEEILKKAPGLVLDYPRVTIDELEAAIDMLRRPDR